MPEQDATPPLGPPGRAEEGFSPGAAVAAWGPVALLAILIVVFRVGGESASASALPAIPGGAMQGHAPEDTASGSGGLALPPLTLPGSDKLIEELNANPWHLQGPAGHERAEGEPAPPPPGAGAPPAPPVASASPPTAPPMPPGGRSWGRPDPAYGYWGAPPTGHGPPTPYGSIYGAPHGAQSDPYWWAQGTGAPPPEPPPPPKD